MKVRAQMKEGDSISHLFIENFENPICNNTFLLFEIVVSIGNSFLNKPGLVIFQSWTPGNSGKREVTPQNWP